MKTIEVQKYIEELKLRPELALEQMAAHAASLELRLSTEHMTCEIYRKALEWCRDVNACDYEYRKIASAALANVKARAPLPAAAHVDHRVEVVVTESHRI